MTWENILKDYSELTDEEEEKMEERGNETIGEIYDNLSVIKKITEKIIEKYNKSSGKDRKDIFYDELEGLDRRIAMYRRQLENFGYYKI